MLNKQSSCQYYAVIVYPQEAGTLLAPAFIQNGITCLCIVPKGNQYNINTNHYDAIFYDDTEQQDSLSRLITALKKYPLLCIVAGSEQSVPLCDQLSIRLGLAFNKPEFADARYNKADMALAAQQAGLTIPKQITVNDDQQINDAISQFKKWPLILKPNNSMGSEDVYLCQHETELRNAFKHVINRSNRLGRKNRTCLIQEYLEGTEYAVDTVSYAGIHRVTAIWQYSKSGNDIIGLVPFDSKRLIHAQGEVQMRLADYTFKLLDAIGIEYGPAHCELILTQDDNVIKLIEIGARLHGGIAAIKMSQNCSQQSQVEHCVHAFIEPKSYINESSSTYTIEQYGEIVLLISPKNNKQAAYSINPHTLQAIKQLGSVDTVSINVNEGQHIAPIAGLITLYNNDLTSLEADLASIRELERTELYQSAL